MTRDFSIFDNFYNKLNSKNKKNLDNRVYVELLFDSLCEMFTYKKSKEYEHIDDSTIESILISNGQIGWGKKNDKIICGFAYDGGKLDINGIGELINGMCLNGDGFTAKNGLTGVLGRNNSSRMADYLIYKFADMLTEVDISKKNNIIYSRQAPIYLAKDSSQAQKIKDFFSKMITGEKLVLAKKAQSVGDTSKEIETVTLTDSETVSKLQYLSQFSHDLLRQFFTFYGHDIMSGGKLAQQSVEEVASSQSMSFIIPFNRLKYRKKMCKDLTGVFGGSIEVDFSEAWKVDLKSWEEREAGGEHYEISGNIQ